MEEKQKVKMQQIENAKKAEEEKKIQKDKIK